MPPKGWRKDQQGSQSIDSVDSVDSVDSAVAVADNDNNTDRPADSVPDRTRTASGSVYRVVLNGYYEAEVIACNDADAVERAIALGCPNAPFKEFEVVKLR